MLGGMERHRTTSIVRAQTPRQFDEARVLFRAYATWLGEDLCYQNFDAELQALPQQYAPPSGSLLLAYAGEEAVGCVAVRALPGVGADACEMKRLFVQPSHWGQGLGRRLAEGIVAEGRQLGYRRMLLDTLRRLERAVALYHALGFREVDAYYDNPLDDVCYMECVL